jgi:acyl-[acyl-carrier-protein]-phospholipid O-acyltransferase/long-chain-fatty-acid--[acyl-carrier-protein] ligase
VLTGGAALPDEVADAFEKRFGLKPLEGYGTAECSPVIALGAPDFRAPGFHQPANKRGFVGQPLPGVAVRVVDPVTGAPLRPNQPGLLLVRGPNVAPSARRPDGWFDTGDLGLLDDDGFLRITGRAGP